MSVPEHFVIPVGIAVIYPLLFTVADFLDNPRAVRILSLVIDTGQKLHHVMLGIARIRGSGCLSLPECIQSID